MTLNEDELKKLAQSYDRGDRARAAYSSDLPTEEVNMLVYDPSDLVRNYIAKHPKLNSEGAVALSQDENWRVRSTVFAHPSLPTDVLIKAWHEYSKSLGENIQKTNERVYGAKFILDNPSLPDSEIDSFIEDACKNRSKAIYTQYSLENLLSQHIAFCGLGSKETYIKLARVQISDIAAIVLNSDNVPQEKKFAFILNGGDGGWNYLSNSSARFQEDFKDYLNNYMPELEVDFSNLTISMVRTVFGEHNDR